jgi:hypothetical protein
MHCEAKLKTAESRLEKVVQGSGSDARTEPMDLG